MTILYYITLFCSSFIISVRIFNLAAIVSGSYKKEPRQTDAMFGLGVCGLVFSLRGICC